MRKIEQQELLYPTSRHVFFDRSQKTFRLYFGESLYVFSLSPELGLEHLYIGRILAPGYDFRYLCQVIK